MNEKREILKISRKELEQLEKAKDLLLSPDFETRYLGYNMFVNNSFYQRCNPKSITGSFDIQTSLYGCVNLLKNALLNNTFEIPIGHIVYIEQRFLKNLNNLNRLKTLKISIQEEELELFKLAYDNLLNDYNNAKKLILSSKTVRDNKDKYFVYQKEFYTIEMLLFYIPNFRNSFKEKLIKKFLEDLISTKRKFYELIPINIEIIDE